jgi:hypothetical protein
MAATLKIGIGTVPISPPSGSAVQEVSTEETVEVKTLRDYTGITKIVDLMGYKTITSNIRGYGSAASVLALVVKGALTTTAKIIEAKITESNEDFPQFDITSKYYKNI